MDFTARVLFVLFSLLTAYMYQQYRLASRPLEAPVFDAKEYWGPGDSARYKEDATIKPFKVAYGEQVINKLRARLEDEPNYAEPLEGTAFEYGFNTKKLQSLVKYWRTTYLDKWNERQQFFNQFDQFKTQIQGLNIHFIHVKPKVPAGTKVYPILLLHGWPGSVREFYEIIPKLTTKSKDNDFVFEVIAPSLPGYGFSDPAAKVGLYHIKMAVIMNNLMLRLGFKQFYVQGGDWGSAIGSDLTTLYPENVLGFHCNMCGVQTTVQMVKTIIASFYPSKFVEEKYVDFYYPFWPKFARILEESGYMHIQATKPDTIGTVLTGNPIGLAAYIIEKFSTWTNPAYRKLADGGLEKYFTLDALLDNIMVYYLTDSITTSQRLYAETLSNAGREYDDVMMRTPVSVPVACAKFKHEIFHTLDWVLKDKYTNLVQSNHFDDGGHFAAMQLPEVMYQDIVSFVKKAQGGTD